MAAQPKLYLTRQSLLREKGLALLVIVFLIGLATTAYVLYSLNSDEMRIEREKVTIQALSTAKSALISWAVSNSSQPGMLPYPDRNGDSNYDGQSDCATVAFNYSFLLGKLPWRAADNANCATLGSGMGNDLKDGQGESLWYAVSRNLVYDYPNAEYPVINPGIINAPTRQWMVVRDKNGSIISDRVAAVILAPGASIGDQDRSGSSANANQYLDKVTLADGNVFKNYDYPLNDIDNDTDPYNDFIAGEDMRNIPVSDTIYQQPYEFNDKLIYITIDELMAAIEKRAAAEAKLSLQKYHMDTGYYPYAAQLGSTQNYSCEQSPAGASGLASGFLPVSYQSCTYTASPASINCIQPIFDAATSGATSVRFRLNSGTFTTSPTPTGSCVLGSSNTECRCTGSGDCSKTTSPTLTVSCTANSCSTVGSATGYFQIRGGKFTNRSGGCTATTVAPVFPTKDSLGCTVSTTSRITCDSSNGSFASCGDVSFEPYLPNWFKNNQWYDYIFYARAPSIMRSTGLTSGSSTVTTTTTGISPGWSVSGRGIPTVSSGNPIDVTVQSIPNATTLVLSNAVTYTGTVPLVFSPVSTNHSSSATSLPSTTTAGNTTITGSFAAIQKGWLVEGTGIPLGTVVATKTSDTALVLSNSASLSGTPTLRFTPLTISQSASTGTGSTTVTTTGSFDPIIVGWSVSGTGIPADTSVSSQASTTTISLSKVATASGTTALTFQPPFVTGSKTGIQALLVPFGKPIVAPSKGSLQSRPSCSAINEYLDSSENTDNDTTYESSSKSRSSSYNDQILIVAP